MNTRETITVEAPVSKTKVVINSYMTGGEMMDLQGIAVGAGMKGVNANSGEIVMNAENAYQKRLRKLVDIMVVSVGEHIASEEKWNALRNLRSNDFNHVMNKVEACASGIDAEEGKD